MWATSAYAETLQGPVGGRAVVVGGGRVVCAPPPGWTVAPDGQSLRPPAGDDAVGRAVELHVAATAAACANAPASVTLVPTGRWPAVDAASVVLAADEGRLDLRGRGLKGMGVHWQSGGRAGDDVCASPQVEPQGERCSFAVGRGLSSDPNAALSWFAAGSRSGPDVATFDANGRRTTPDDFVLRPARVVLRSLIPADASIDLTAGAASRLPLVHPEAVAAVDCGAANCELADGAVVVRSLQNVTGTLSVRLRLVPHVTYARADKEDPAPVFSVSVLPCAVSVASGDVIRGVDDARVVLRLDPRCGTDVRPLRFTVAGRTVDVLGAASERGAEFVLLRIGRVDGEELAVNVVRDSDGSALGVARAKARDAPQPRALVELPGHGPIDFIPNNRSAIVRFANPGVSGARLVLLGIDNVYEVTNEAGGTAVRGLPTAAGFVALRFGYRVDGLPSEFASADLAIVTDPLERPIREANLPAPLGASALGEAPMVELLCGDGEGGTIHVKPGSGATHVPFPARDTCRVVFHRSRVPPEDGAQRLHLDIDVTRVDGTPRPEAHVSEAIVLRAGKEDRYAWIRGLVGRFDRVTVRLSHEIDESHYVGGSDLRSETPSVQWSFTAGTGHARIYATTAIPTGLYRVSDRAHSGILTLNFGAIVRLTWLDQEGHEGFLGLEGGVMGVGLAGDQSAQGRSLTQLATVTGIGLSVPIANRSLETETSINLHAWLEYEISRDLGGGEGNAVGFVFGPSISIGNIGANL